MLSKDAAHMQKGVGEMTRKKNYLTVILLFVFVVLCVPDVMGEEYQPELDQHLYLPLISLADPLIRSDQGDQYIPDLLGPDDYVFFHGISSAPANPADTCISPVVIDRRLSTFTEGDGRKVNLDEYAVIHNHELYDSDRLPEVTAFGTRGWLSIFHSNIIPWFPPADWHNRYFLVVHCQPTVN